MRVTATKKYVVEHGIKLARRPLNASMHTQLDAHNPSKQANPKGHTELTGVHSILIGLVGQHSGLLPSKLLFLCMLDATSPKTK